MWCARNIMTVTLEEIARLAGVSLSTASRVINGHPNVRSEVREHVLQVIHEHGYQPDPAARSLASRRTGIIGADQSAGDRSSDHAV
jgi:DNA-binding LacI/PurR family transcriptional regulator